MRTLSCFMIAFLFVGLAACNNAGKNNEASSDSAMDHHMAAVQPGNAMPAIPDGAGVYFKNLKDGQAVTSPFKVEMGVTGMSVDSAGVVKPGSGHHHILIDAGDSLAAGTVVPSDSNHLHFGNAQTETELSLPPGKHQLTLQFADGIHRSYGGKLAASITITVKK